MNSFIENDKANEDIKSQKNQLFENIQDYKINVGNKNEENKREIKTTVTILDSPILSNEEENTNKLIWNKLFEDNCKEIIQEEESRKSEGMLEEKEEEEDSEIIDEKEGKKEETITLSKSHSDYNICKVNNISYENKNFIIRNDNSKINNNKNKILQIEEKYSQVKKDDEMKNSNNFSSSLLSKVNSNIIIQNLTNKNIKNTEISNKNQNIKSYIEEKNIIYKSDDTIIFNGKSFKKYDKVNKYKTKDNISRIVYKCNNYRKFEKFRIGIKNSTFCNATIIFILPN